MGHKWRTFRTHSTRVFWVPAKKVSYFEIQQMAFLHSTAVLHFICSTRLLAGRTPSVGSRNNTPKIGLWCYATVKCLWAFFFSKSLLRSNSSNNNNTLLQSKKFGFAQVACANHTYGFKNKNFISILALIYFAQKPEKSGHGV